MQVVASRETATEKSAANLRLPAPVKPYEDYEQSLRAMTARASWTYERTCRQESPLKQRGGRPPALSSDLPCILRVIRPAVAVDKKRLWQ